jgi:hypothetical protein
MFDAQLIELMIRTILSKKVHFLIHGLGIYLGYFRIKVERFANGSIAMFFIIPEKFTRNHF